jgi:hypothetical protein
MELTASRNSSKMSLSRDQGSAFRHRGTLLDSVDLHAESWVRTFAHFGIAAKTISAKGPIASCLRKGTSIARQKEIEQ